MSTQQNFQTVERLITLLPKIPEDLRRSLVEVLCESGLRTISRLVEEVGSTQHPVDVATTIINVSLRAGHPDVLNQALNKVDVCWPPEVVLAFWAATSPAAAHLPARDALWDRFEARALPRLAKIG